MAEPDPDSIVIDLSRLNDNILQAIKKDDYAAFPGLNPFDKAYIEFRLDPEGFGDCPYRPAMFNVSRKTNPALIDIMSRVYTESTDIGSKIQPVDLTILRVDQLTAIADDVEAFEYLNFNEQVWLCNTLKRPIIVTDPKRFFPSRWINILIDNSDLVTGGKRIKSRKPRRKTRRKTRRHN